MKILILGDVVGSIGCNFLKSNLPKFKINHNIDFVVANGENSADGNGISHQSINDLFKSGVNVITTGNHIFKNQDYKDILSSNEFVIRPANFFKDVPGNGYCIFILNNIKICVINLIGRIFIARNINPFDSIDEILNKVSADIFIVDFHAEATSEKLCLAYYLDYRVTAVVGTHTHVQTADETILPGKTAYITDLGMVGPINSVLGVDKDIAIRKIRCGAPIKFKNSTNPCQMSGIILTLDDSYFIPQKIKRINFS